MSSLSSVGKLLLSGAVLLLASSVHSSAQDKDKGEIEFQLEFVTMKPQIADMLEQRLRTGGQTALDAAAKLPGLRAKGTVRAGEKLVFRCSNGKRVKAGGNGRVLKPVPDIEYPAGFNVEAEAYTDQEGKMVSANLAISFVTALKRGEFNQKELTVMQSFCIGAPASVMRVDTSPTSSLLLLGTVKVDGKPAVKEVPEDFGQANVRAELFEFSTNKALDDFVAAAKQKPAAAYDALKKKAKLRQGIGCSSSSGQRWRVRDWVGVPADEDVRMDGPSLEIEAVIGKGGKRIDLSGEFLSDWRSGERARRFDGVRVDQWIKLSSEIRREVDSGSVSFFPCTVKMDPAGGVAGGSKFLLAVHANAYGTFAAAPAGAGKGKAKGAGDDGGVGEILAQRGTIRADGLQVRVYAVPPRMMRKLSERKGLEDGETAKKILSANGISFEQKSSKAAFLAKESQLIIMLGAEEIKKVEKLLKTVGRETAGGKR